MSAVSGILASMKRLALLGLTFAAATAPLSAQDLFTRVVTRIAKTPNTGVGVFYRRLDRPDSLLVDAGHRFHAASTMKVPVMIQVFRDADAGTLRLGDSLTVVNEFHSIVDGSPYQLDKADDSDSSLYLRVGQKAAVGDLLELMITVSSNLATDILIERVGAARANATAHALGADSILVLRGVEDGVAYRAGRNNTTTARDLGGLLAAIAGLSPGVSPASNHPQGPSMRPYVVLLMVLCVAPIAAQQRPVVTADDYARAERFLGYNTTPLVFGVGVRPTWLADGGGRFWYRIAIPQGFG